MEEHATNSFPKLNKDWIKLAKKYYDCDVHFTIGLAASESIVEIWHISTLCPFCIGNGIDKLLMHTEFGDQTFSFAFQYLN